MNVHLDVVSDINSAVLFTGTTEDTVKYLETEDTTEPRYVYIGATGDILMASEYLDLASD